MYKTEQTIRDWHWVCSKTKWVMGLLWLGLGVLVGFAYVYRYSLSHLIDKLFIACVIALFVQVGIILFRNFGELTIKKLWASYVEEMVNGRYSPFQLISLPTTGEEKVAFDQLLALLLTREVKLLFHTEQGDHGTFHVPIMHPNDPLSRILYTYRYPLDLSRDALEECFVKRLRNASHLGKRLDPSVIVHPFQVLFPPLDRY